MKNIKHFAVFFFILMATGCRPEPDMDQLALLDYSFDINGESYQQKIAFEGANVQYLMARARKKHECPTETIWISLSMVVFKGGYSEWISIFPVLRDNTKWVLLDRSLICASSNYWGSLYC